MDKKEVGENISRAVHVMRETHKNIDKFMRQVTVDSENFGYQAVLPTYYNGLPKFLRYVSVPNYKGWLTDYFVLLFQNANGKVFDNGWREGFIFALQIFLAEENVPELILGRYEFENISGWTKMFSPADYWIFDNPTWQEENFEIVENGEFKISKPRDKTVSENYYFGMQEMISKSFDLLDVTAENIGEKIFGTFDELANCRFRGDLS